LARRTHLMRLLLATRGDCRRRVAYPGTRVKPSIPVQTWPEQAGCAQSSPVDGTDVAQSTINSGEPGQAAEAAVCRLHAACGTRRHQWQYLGISVGGAGVLVRLFEIGRRSGRDLVICVGARRPRRVGDMMGGLERRPCSAPAFVGRPALFTRVQGQVQVDGSGHQGAYSDNAAARLANRHREGGASMRRLPPGRCCQC
jgi:hypothetical protein